MDFVTDLKTGMQNEVQDTVTEKNTAAAVGSGSLPVYATPAMMGLMEQAAAEMAEAYMPEGWTTVGILMNVAHQAATPIGLQVRAVAEVIAIY